MHVWQMTRVLRTSEGGKMKLFSSVKIDVEVDRLRSHRMLVPWCLNQRVSALNRVVSLEIET